MTLEVLDYVTEYRNDSLNIGELIRGTKIPKNDNGKIIWHNEINENTINPQDGLCVFCGLTSMNLMVLDLDNEELFGYFKNYLDETFVVKTGKKGYHIYFRTVDPPKSKSLTNSKGQHIDILGQGKIAVLPPTIHPETNRQYEIISNLKIKQITTQEEQALNQKLKELGFAISEDKKPVKELYDSNFVKTEGTNRGEDLLRVIESNYSKNKDLTESMLFALANQFNTDHFNPPYEESKIRSLVKQGIEFIDNKNGNVEVSRTEVKRNSKDRGVIDLIAKDIKEKYSFVTIRATNEILSYNGKIYSKSEAESTIKTETENRINDCTTHDRNEVVNKIKAQTGANLDEFDEDSNLVTLVNGILNLETLEVTNHNPKYLSRVLLPVEFTEPINQINDETIIADIEENLKDTLFWKFLKRSFTVDGQFRKDDFETVLEIMASPIIKRHIDEKAFMFLGQGENGKSVCLDYVKSLIGKDNISRVTLQQIAEDKFMVAQLAGKSANIFTDLENGDLRYAGKIKAITSGEGLEAQEKYMKPFVLDPFCKLMFSCNRFPKVYDQSHAFFRRWMIVKWERNFENDPERIEYLREKLASNQEEKNLVFSCLVYLARKLNRVGKFAHTKDSSIIQKEWNENADPLDDFVTNYVVDSETNKSKREVHQFYKRIMLSKGENPLGMGQFSKAFGQYYEEEKTKHERVWINIDFKEPVQTNMKDYEDRK